MHRRSWLRVTLTVLGALFVLGAAATFALRLQWRGDLDEAASRFQQEVGTLDPRQVEPPRIPDSENAASWLVAAASALVVDDTDEVLFAARRPREEWPPGAVEAARGLVAAHPEPSSLAARAVPLERSSFGARWVPDPVPVGGVGEAKMVPDIGVDLLEQLRLAAYLRLTVAVALDDGDCGRAVDRFEVSARQAQALLSEPMVLFGLIGSAVSDVVIEGLFDIVSSCDDPVLAGELERALAALERLAGAERAVDEVLHGEGVSSLAQVALMLDQNERLPSRWLGEPHLRVEAVMIDHWRELIVASRGGAPELRRWSELQRDAIERPRSEAEQLASMLTPNLVYAAQKMQLGASARNLADAALRHRIASLRAAGGPQAAAPYEVPYEVPESPTPYLGERIQVVRLADGRVELALPASAADWESSQPRNELRPRLSWRLPELVDRALPPEA